MNVQKMKLKIKNHNFLKAFADMSRTVHISETMHIGGVKRALRFEVVMNGQVIELLMIASGRWVSAILTPLLPVFHYASYRIVERYRCGN